MRRLLTLSALALSSYSLGLGIGDKAPALKVEATLKGKRVDLSRGLHIVEFWATWCHPCIDAMPHLTELAKKYGGKADFTGVDVMEHGDDQLGQVKRFVTGMGPKMGYNVVFDGASKTMSTTWLDAAKQYAIPASFIVKDGTILWIGHPMEGLDEAVDDILKGNFDLDASKAKFTKESAAMERMMHGMTVVPQLMKPVDAAQKAGDYPAALAALDAAEAKNPDYIPDLESARYNLLALMDSPELLGLANRFATDDYKDEPYRLDQIAWKSIDPKGTVAKPNYAAALVLARRALEANGMKSARILNTYAYALYRTGYKAKAVEIQTKAIEIASASGKTLPETLNTMQEQLKTYKKDVS